MRFLHTVFLYEKKKETETGKKTWDNVLLLNQIKATCENSADLDEHKKGRKIHLGRICPHPFNYSNIENVIQDQ